MEECYSKIPHYSKIEKSSEENIIPAHNANITQEKTCIKFHVFKPIYKYKKSVQALSSYHDKCLQWIYMLRGRKKNTFNSFFSYKNDTRYIISYSFSQQNEFYKVYNTKKKKNHSCTKLFLTLQHQYLLQNYLHKFNKNIRPLLRIYHNYLQLTGKSRKILNPTDNASRTPQCVFPVVAVA